ncbi:MAG: Hpt domain-containing protein, partial [Spirochaetaceae bacterium]|nr:Hpt domain-containing protein [Spirochaetaceae bacterium]
MDSALAHIDEFLQNAEEIMTNLNKDLELWREDIYNSELINRIFRYMHSLKSGAAFLELSILETTAHKLESLFDGFRKGAVSDKIRIDTIFKAVRHMGKELDRLNEFRNPVILDFPQSDQYIQKEKPAVKRDLFTAFQKELLKEASFRGERFYRIICHIDEFPQMLYARAYLLMNNLELEVNVISTTPSMKDREADFTRFTAYITTDLEEKDIYRAVNVDSVIRVDLIRLDYSSYLEREDDDVITLNFEETDQMPTGTWIRVEQRRIDELAGYIDQLKISTGRFSSYRTKMDELHSLAKGMEKVLLNVTLVPMNSLFKGFPRFVRELCRKTGKSAELKITGEQCTIDRSVFDVLAETLQHIIRNAVYHGLETIDERRSLGKSESGIIEIHTSREDEQIVLTVSDDGRGVNRDKLFEEAVKRGYSVNRDDIDLLSILSRPGFSTVENPDSLSGRGVGLDLVVHNIQNKLKGEIELNSVLGKGLEYRIVIPASPVMTKIIIMRSSGRTIAFPARNVESSAPFDHHMLIEDQNGILSYRSGDDELPIFTESGKLHQKTDNFDKGYILIVRYLGLKAALYADELLMEKELLSENLRLHDEK